LSQRRPGVAALLFAHRRFRMRAAQSRDNSAIAVEIFRAAVSSSAFVV
jgi:hypothetical protein